MTAILTAPATHTPAPRPPDRSAAGGPAATDASPVLSPPAVGRDRGPRLPRPDRRGRGRRPLVGDVLLDLVEAHPSNIRRNLGDLRDLVESIASFGVMQPVVLEDLGHGRLRVRAGHRRVAAARLAGLTRVPAVVHPDPLDDDEWLIHAAHENTRRRGLDRADILRAYQQLREAGVTRDAASAAVGKSTHTLATWAANGNGNGRAIRARISRTALTQLVEDFRGRPAATAADVLTALDRLLTDLASTPPRTSDIRTPDYPTPEDPTSQDGTSLHGTSGDVR